LQGGGSGLNVKFMRFHVFDNKIAILFCLAAVLLAGCGTVPFAAKAQKSCPEAGIVLGAAEIPLAEKNRIKIDGVAMECRTRRSEQRVDIKIDFAFKGAAEAQGQPDIPLHYFVAVLDDQENILSREAFSGTLPMSGDDAGRLQEEISIHLPKPNVTIALGLIPPVQQKDQP
jgi:hypothetical protein